MPTKPFGYLLALDLYACDVGNVDDIRVCYAFLEELVVTLCMQKQAPPFVFRSDEVAYPEKAGISGWIPLIESGIQIHTLSKHGFVSIDVYSCREFKAEDVIQLARRYYMFKDHEVQLLVRGSKRPWCMTGNSEPEV